MSKSVIMGLGVVVMSVSVFFAAIEYSNGGSRPNPLAVTLAICGAGFFIGGTNLPSAKS